MSAGARALFIPDEPVEQRPELVSVVCRRTFAVGGAAPVALCAKCVRRSAAHGFDSCPEMGRVRRERTEGISGQASARENRPAPNALRASLSADSLLEVAIEHGLATVGLRDFDGGVTQLADFG